MNRPCLSFFLVMLLSIVFVTGRCQDTAAEKRLILNQPIFSSETEKKYFKEIAATGSTDLLQLMLVAGNTNYSAATGTTASERIASFIQQRLEPGKQYSSKEIKKIYADIHQEFFTRYIENPVFSQIFANGSYNCATASALYAILLNKLNIEYSIREKPTHVYIVAAPSSHNIIFETTAPGAMVMQLNENAKTKFLEYLHDNKLVGKEEWESSDRNALFDKYFYDDEAIDLQQLCGLLYYNLGIEAAQKDDYATAYKNFEKAYFLHPGSRMKYFVSGMLAAWLYKAVNLTEEEKISGYNRYMQVGDSVTAKEMIADLFEKVSKKYLFQYPDVPRYFTLYRDIVKMVKDTALLGIIRHDHYVGVAHYYSIKEDLDSTRLYLDSLYRLNTSDLLVKEQISTTIYNSVRKLPEGKEAVLALKDYFKTYPFLRSNSTLQDYYVYCLIREVATKYEADNEKEGKVFFEDLKAVLDGQPALARRSELYVTAVIPDVCGYYARKKNYKTVKEILLFFKKILPDNEEVNRRLKNVEIRLKNP